MSNPLDPLRYSMALVTLVACHGCSDMYSMVFYPSEGVWGFFDVRHPVEEESFISNQDTPTCPECGDYFEVVLGIVAYTANGKLLDLTLASPPSEVSLN